MTLTIPLVGQNFVPPARQVISVLPLGTKLFLYPEDDNEYDSNAVRVVVDMADYPIIKLPLLQTALLGTNFDACELCIQGPLKLGYLAATGKATAKGSPGNQGARLLASTMDNGFNGLEATLSAAPDGSPQVVITNGS